MSGEAGSSANLDVSRETMDRLNRFVAVLEKWNPRINLVSRNSISEVWTRHIADSLQVFRCTTPIGHWVDLGSGGGFPGLVIAILAQEMAPDLRVTLVESDQRKSAFLRTAAREAGVRCTVITERIETLEPQEADILSARALADLETLMDYTQRHLKPGGVALFPKGVTWKKECVAARQRWNFNAEQITSKTDPDAVILKIEGVSRA
ncbi:16S rRNA (guanine(527)-N(7))-methyltransferase RsmG [Antarcticimicrobium sediminis]|uniref:Ribosomal RNA small subunit methyltransferase G n=1 Tax=Antarcticimicrobium sediminis TaxID=2546227 RepID=A0A4R5EQY9_9RHOB|nr:16S rRNA (guanine(527)-N(7))-methyltransferase RsmG [Antarcticimicrobium sediminis]TDE37003.1 16S rRNA (guanine(527)-N(7))-methyltransferase RsmG [Antarcticimicrobium sediminis]